MNRQIILTAVLALILLAFISIKSVPSNACVEPYSGMEIAEDMELCPGDWNVNGGVRIIKDNVRLNCNGARLFGEGNVGVYIGNRSGITVENCALLGYAYGITSCTFYNCLPLSDSKIINNEIVANVGIFVKEMINSKKSKNNIIANNIISSDFGIDIKYSSENVIENNTISTSFFETLSLQFSDKNIIKNNNFASRDKTYPLIKLSYSNKNMILNNKITGYDIMGISVRGLNNVISNNLIEETIVGFNGIGISILPGSEFTEVSNNIIKRLLKGIYMIHPSNVKISSNNILLDGYGIIIDNGLGENVKIDYNNFDYSRYSKYHIINNAPQNLNAELNYFGTTNPFLIKNKISGPVDYCPILDAPYPNGNELSCDNWCQTPMCPKP